MLALLCVCFGLLIVVLALVVILFADRGVASTRIDFLASDVAREAKLAEERGRAELLRHGELLEAIQHVFPPALPGAISGGMAALHKGIEAVGNAVAALPEAIHNREGPLSTAEPPVSGWTPAPLPLPTPPPRRTDPARRTVRSAPPPSPVEATLVSLRLDPEEQDTTQAMSTKDLKQALSAAAMLTTLLAALALGCSDPGPGPIPDAGADDTPLCTATPPGCPSCNTVYNSVGAPGTTPGDLCSGTCSFSRWIWLQDCAFGPCAGSCGPGETLVPNYVWDPACEACLSAKCDAEGCKADK